MIPIHEQSYPLPVDWQWTLWGKCGSFIAGSAFKKEFQGLKKHELPFYKVASLKFADDQGYLFDEADTITDDVRKALKAKLIQTNSLLFAKIGEAIKLNRRALNNAPCCIDNNLIAFVAEKILPRYAYYWSFTVNLYEYTNATTVPAIRKSDLEKIPIPLPPLDEQQRIVALLDELFADLDEAKALAQSVVDGSELRRAAILHKAFTGELSQLWRDEHGTTLDSWQRCRLGDVCQINPPKISTRNLSDDLEVSFVSMAAVSEVRGEITAPQKKFLREVKSGFTNFAEGDVLFAKITPCMENGKAALVGELVNHIGYGSTEFFVLRCGEKILNHFVYHLVRWQIFRNEAKSVMAGAVGQQRVPKRFLTSYQLNLPPPEEQKEIVRLLDDLLGREQQTKDLALKMLERVELMKKSILARAFRGELGINKNLRAI